ncbi:class I SAM-dependent methyltransferase [Streptomyces turgidiscabies]|uniref:2-polyprenyl-3-methyl-5-hydroxy-6-metoxy-1, 4-benzoquinol methylase n=1 Tax=Streptomyces turgidiscabies TaxID=85558 RepID=A0ABU0RPK9_9ACTN|nr:class I SAM-dependent methyltransferase [Streptomyces turgidiscabies]MDQ0933925.1 2-polyprenyl-3-methyl-5-hydroxy-6-metoxy-1,4-benzoquinol methylase [Streptomyces turgidiscabies]
MTILPPSALRALERFHAARPWDHNAHYHPWIMRQLPRRYGRALDVGCGSGDLVRLLAGRSTASVLGVDSDPGIVQRARELTSPALPVEFSAADAMTGLTDGPDALYDVITCVAVVHHLPYADALTLFRRRLAPGGTLVVVGLARAASPVDHLLGCAAIPANVLMAWVKNRGRATERPVAMSARTRAAEMAFSEVVREARRVLPGCRVRRRLFWRYTLFWRQPVRS